MPVALLVQKDVQSAGVVLVSHVFMQMANGVWQLMRYYAVDASSGKCSTRAQDFTTREAS